MTTWQTRAKARLKQLKLTQEDLVTPLGVKTRGAVGHYLSGRRGISIEQAAALCKVLRMAHAELFGEHALNGGAGSSEEAKTLPEQHKESTPAPSNYVITPQAAPLGILDTWDSSTPIGDDEVELPLFREVELAAGAGRTQVIENHGAKLRFARSTLSRKGIDPSNAACCFVSGDSMANILPDGSTVAVDTSQKTIIDGKMYAIDHGGMLRVKYLHRLPNGGVKISSENHSYADEIVNADALEDLRVIGRIFWYAVLL